MKKTKVSKKKLSDVKVYNVSLKILGKVYGSEGQSVTEALNKLEAPKNIKGVGILTVSNGDLTKERILSPVNTFRLFNGSGLMKEIAIKQISNIFGL